MTGEVVDWFRRKIEEIRSTNEDKKSILIELKSGVSALDVETLLYVIREVHVNPLFDCLNSQDAEVIETATDVLFNLLNVLSGEECLVTYSEQIQRGLGHTSPYVKRSFLKLLQKYVSVEAVVYLSSNHPNLLTNVIECLPCPDRSIAEGAVVFFKRIGKSLHGVQILFSDVFQVILKRIMAVDDITRFRIYEIVVDAAVSTPEGLLAGHSSGILPSLLNELKSNDTLIQLNALELLTNLTATSDGLLYLQREGVIKYLVDKILNIHEEPLSFILLPGLIEFFGNLYKLQPIVFSQQHPEVLSLLFQSFETVDPALLGVVISTMGKIGFTNEGKRVLVANGEKSLAFFKKLGHVIQRKDELSVTAMNTLAVLLKTNDLTLSESALSWFNALGQNALEVILTSAKLPFIELRLAGLELLLAISSQDWGSAKMFSLPGLMEFLLDRNAEFDKNCKYIKYNIIKSLISSPEMSGSLPGDICMKLKQFVSDGPYFVATEPEMAFEGAS